MTRVVQVPVAHRTMGLNATPLKSRRHRRCQPLHALRPHGKIKVVMIVAPWIETRSAGGASSVPIQVSPNTQLASTCATADGPLVPLRLGPDLDRMIGQCVMALPARVVPATTPEADGDNVQRTVIVHAARLRVQPDTVHLAAARSALTKRHGVPGVHALCRRRRFQTPSALTDWRSSPHATVNHARSA